MRAVAERSWANRDLVRERDRERVRRLWALIPLAALALVPLTLYQLQQNRWLERSYEANELRVEHERLLERERRLRVERARLSSLASIETWARRQGLEPPAPEQAVVVETAPQAAGELVAGGGAR